MKKQAKFGIGIGVIVISLGFLAWLGYGESKTYDNRNEREAHHCCCKYGRLGKDQ